MQTIDLTPAKWIWIPSERTLPNTFVLFRKDVHITAKIQGARGWITADSRYRLTVNGHRVQWGPAPSDPRWADVDPVDLTTILQVGVNTIGVEVMFYGNGDGTWVAGKPGLLFRLVIVDEDGNETAVESNATWQCLLDRAHSPGQFKRWYLRSLQEDFDARIHPVGWDEPDFKVDSRWLPAMELGLAPNLPSVCSSYVDYLFDSGITGSDALFLRERQIPLIRESKIMPNRLAEAGTVTWHRDPKDWFESRIPDSFEFRITRAFIDETDSGWEISVPNMKNIGLACTFEFKEQMVGFPYFRITAPEGTIVELMYQEAHQPGESPWLDSHRYSWTRYTCREGLNEFTAFEYESLRWIQLHIRGHHVPVQLHAIGLLRREYDWPFTPDITVEDRSLQRLMDACVNTTRNNSLDTVVDGNGRERQQYSGDIGHQLYSIRAVFGDVLLPARFLRTFSEGLTLDGYFMDCWPAYDRMVRIAQRQVGLTKWGPMVDHGVQFVFDNWNHYLATGDMHSVQEPYPRLVRFAQWLESLRKDDGLLPVEGLGTATVWIDHDAYKSQRDKQCAFNLYVAAMYRDALAPLMKLFNDEKEAKCYEQYSEDIVSVVQQRFWDDQRGLYINNLPWIECDEEARTCDRSLATALLFHQIPSDRMDRVVEVLDQKPSWMGLSYPPNAIWRYRALAQARRVGTILTEFRDDWSHMPSIIYNNTLSENWRPRTDSSDQWSHASTAPLEILFSEIAGIKPLKPGYVETEISPQLGDLPYLRLTARTVLGPIHFEAKKNATGHDIRINLPRDMTVRTSGVKITHR